MEGLDERLAANRESYRRVYDDGANLMYPASWVVRFHNIFMRAKPRGRALDFGCGNGNNAKFLIDAGWETYGTEVTEAALPSIYGKLGPYPRDRFTVLPPMPERLPYDDGFFSLVVSNQVLYYLAEEAAIKAVCREFRRVLAPGGLVFLTMQGPRNVYIAKFGERVAGKTWRVTMPAGHRLHGRTEFLYVPESAKDVTDLFDDFSALSVGHFEEVFDGESTFHWMFVGQRSS